MFQRPDFLNLCLASIALATQLESITFVNKWVDIYKYTIFFYWSLIAFVFDVMFLFVMTQYWNSDDYPEDGGVQRNVRRISLAVSYISFFFRPVVIFVFFKLWKHDER